MYAGTTFNGVSGKFTGVHQKIDRIARKHIKKYVDDSAKFPAINEILFFEGNNGPDGIKRKSPSKDEPWHYIDPSDPSDHALVDIINDNLHNLSMALEHNNQERAAYEAAWLAHAVVDGLTPAHHYPLDDKIEELWGKPHHERMTIKDKNIIKGLNARDTISKNWQYWGAKGVFTAHVAFELGVSATITGHRFNSGAPKPADLKRVEVEGFEKIFLEAVHRIDDMKLYDEFGHDGWTHDLADKTRRILMPEIIKTVAQAWYYAAYKVKK